MNERVEARMRKTDWQRLSKVEHQWGWSVLFADYSRWVSQRSSRGGPWYIRLLNRREKRASDIRPEACIPTSQRSSTTDKWAQGIPIDVVELIHWSPLSLLRLHNRNATSSHRLRCSRGIAGKKKMDPVNSN